MVMVTSSYLTPDSNSPPFAYLRPRNHRSCEKRNLNNLQILAIRAFAGYVDSFSLKNFITEPLITIFNL